MEGLQLISTGGALPSRVVTNEDLSKLVDTSDEWITTRTGIRQRRFCGEGQTTATLAIEAAKQALERSGLQAEQIGWFTVSDLFQSDTQIEKGLRPQAE